MSGSKISTYTPGTSTIDITAPGGIARLLDFHRAHFGDARMQTDGTEAGADEAGGAGTSAAATDAGETGAAATGAQTPPPADGDEPWADPAKARAEIERLRRENGAARTNAKAQAADEARAALVQELGKALGLVKDGEQAPDADALKTAATQAQADARAAQVELAVYKAAAGAKGDPAALLDSRAFLAKVADLDPTANDFQTQVTSAITAAVTENPKLASTVQVAGASSVDHAGGSGEGAVTKERFEAMTPAEKNQLFQSNPTLYRTLTGR